MHVSIMGRSLRPGFTGVGSYVSGLVESVAQARPSRNVSVFLTQDAPAVSDPNLIAIRAPFPTPNEYVRAFWEQTVVPWEVSRRGIDLYHSPNYILPVALRAPSIVTIHDLTYLDASLHKWTSHHYLRTFVSLAVRKADAIVAVSEHSKLQIEQHYPEAIGRVHAIYQGYRRNIQRPCSAEIENFLEVEALHRPYVLFVGTIEPRKNIPRLIAAFELAVRVADLDHHLYLVGGWGWKSGGARDALRASPLADRIHSVGYVVNEQLPLYYAGADLFVYPSIEEGFGLPPLEAMVCGTPVVTSNCSSLPEVVGDAAITVDPFDVKAIAEAMASTLADARLRERLRTAGFAQSQRFSWAKSAEEHVRLYETVLGRA